MKLRSRLIAGLAALAALAAPLAAEAHRAWILPSFTVVSGDNPWVGIDGAHAIRKVTMTATPPAVGPLIRLTSNTPSRYFDAASSAA